MADGTATGIGLWAFTTDERWARQALAAGVSTFVIDWEHRDKELRQSGADTQINCDTPEDLARISQIGGARTICRVNAWSEWTAREVDVAVEAGAGALLLPMVAAPEEVREFLGAIDGRCRAGILVETQSACECAPDLAALPLDLVYVGLNDLAISRGTPSIFHALWDGTVRRVREQFPQIPFGFGGLTVVDGGAPIPCIRLLEEMARLRCEFSFLRRSFHRDIRGRALAREIRLLERVWRRLLRRSAAEQHADHLQLQAAIEQAFPVCTA